jgi:predicted tellurium resistance membrane protein TerC
MELLTFENFFGLVSLTCLEIILGFDNIVMLSLMVNRLAPEKRELARRLGLALALLFRVALLLSISWIMLLTKPLFEIFGQEFSGRNLILLAGGLFLIAKATFEIHDATEHPVHLPEEEKEGGKQKKKRKVFASFGGVILQIALLDIVFSLDSVITAVGMAQHLPVMVAAIVIAIVVMLLFSRAIGTFIDEHPTFKILALSFLELVGATLVLEGFGKHVEKGYIYFAIGYSLTVEFINLRMRKRSRLQLLEAENQALER